MRSYTLSRTVYSITCIVGVILCAGSVHASESAEGYIVFLDKKELVVNLGYKNGLLPKSKIQLYRRLVVMHPYTNQPIVDRFPIGSVPPDEIGKSLSIVRRWKGLSRAPERGDIAVFKAEPLPKKSSPKPLLLSKGSQSIPLDSQALQQIFTRILGQPIADRIRAYEQFIKDYPKSVHVDSVGHEIRAMRLFEKQLRRPKKVAVTAPKKPVKINARSATPSPIFLGEDIEIVVAITRPKEITKVSLLVARSQTQSKQSRGKKSSSEGWTIVTMTPDGDYYYRAKLPAKLTTKAGQLDYFIEAVRNDSSFEAIYKSASNPGLITIKPPLPGETKPGKTRVSIMGRMVDFNQPGSASDAYNQFETSISYQVDYLVLRAVRFGVGSLSGGCTLNSDQECMDNEPTTPDEGQERRLSLNYAFAEAEIGGQWVGLSARVAGGNHQGGAGNTASQSDGFELRARIGELNKTRLVLGIASLDDLGSKGFLDAHIEVLEKVPLKAGVVVTSLPVQSKDWGVQLSAQAGYRLTEMVSVQGLIGWNARTINHYGFTFGGGLGLEW